MSVATKRASLILSLLVLASLIITACAPATAADLLGEVKARGTLRISTDVNYAPQSASVEGAKRADGTKCAADELTANQVEGFDIDTAVEIAKRLGVEPCFVTPDWTLITAGSWGGRWDVSVGSMTITKERQNALWFTPPYYSYSGQLAARVGSGINSINDVAGKAVCVASATTYEDYFTGKISIPDSDIKTKAPADVKVVSLSTDSECAQAIQAGRTDFDVFMTSATVVEKAIKDGIPVTKVGEPVYVEKLAVAIDKQAPKDPKSLLDAISKIVTDMHSDGTLTKSSLKWYEGVDLTVVK